MAHFQLLCYILLEGKITNSLVATIWRAWSSGETSMPWSRHHSPQPTKVSPSPCMRLFLCVCCACWQPFGRNNSDKHFQIRKVSLLKGNWWDSSNLHIRNIGNNHCCNFKNMEHEHGIGWDMVNGLTNLFQVNRDSPRRNWFFEQNRRVCSALVCWGMSTETCREGPPHLLKFFSFLEILSFRVAFEKLVYDLSCFEKNDIDSLGCTNRNSRCPRLLSQSQSMSSLLLVACSTLNYNSFQLNER